MLQLLKALWHAAAHCRFLGGSPVGRAVAMPASGLEPVVKIEGLALRCAWRCGLRKKGGSKPVAPTEA